MEKVFWRKICFHKACGGSWTSQAAARPMVACKARKPSAVVQWYIGSLQAMRERAGKKQQK